MGLVLGLRLIVVCPTVFSLLSLPPAKKLREGNVFSWICLFTGGYMFKLVHLGTTLAPVPGPNPPMDLFKLVHFWKWEVDLQLKGLFVIIKFFSTPTHDDKHWQCDSIDNKVHYYSLNRTCPIELI